MGDLGLRVLVPCSACSASPRRNARVSIRADQRLQTASRRTTFRLHEHGSLRPIVRSRQRAAGTGRFASLATDSRAVHRNSSFQSSRYLEDLQPGAASLTALAWASLSAEENFTSCVNSRANGSICEPDSAGTDNPVVRTVTSR